MVKYDKHYETENLFGDPYPELIEFFANYASKQKLLDLGCGQGRNSIALARLRYQVTGVDNSKIGIQQMLHSARKEKVDLTGLIGDIHEIDDYATYDIVLLDSMFHFWKNDFEGQSNLIKNICQKLKSGGVICICIQKTGSKIKTLEKIITDTGIDFEVLLNKSIQYHYQDQIRSHQSKTPYQILALKKR